jgi:SMI1-KNR4 cell-wall
MVSADLQSLVAANAEWFLGVRHESAASLDEAERLLGVPLPISLRWLLSKYGYSSACGVASLAMTVEETLRCREAIGLPPRYVLLEDRGDSGVVLLDAASASGRVVWVGAHEVGRLTDGEAAEDADEFPDFESWVRHCLEDAKDWADA